MVSIKKLEQFFERDPTHEFFSALTLEHLYECISQYCTLHEGVPEDIRDYFHVVVSLYLYGWLYYPFYMLASERSLFAVELALRKRLPAKKLDKKGRDRRSLADLLREAKDAGLLRDEGFPSLENRRKNAQELDEQIARISGRDPEPESQLSYVEGLIQTLPQLRNRFAHPNMQLIMPPGPMLDSLIVTAEIIDQLWPASASK